MRLFYAGITIILPIVNDDFNSVLRFDCRAGRGEGRSSERRKHRVPATLNLNEEYWSQ